MFIVNMLLEGSPRDVMCFLLKLWVFILHAWEKLFLNNSQQNPSNIYYAIAKRFSQQSPAFSSNASPQIEILWKRKNMKLKMKKSSNKIDWTPTEFPKELFVKRIKAGWKHVYIGKTGRKNEATTRFFVISTLYTINKYQYLSNVFLITFKEVLFVYILELSFKTIKLHFIVFYWNR